MLNLQFFFNILKILGECYLVNYPVIKSQHVNYTWRGRVNADFFL